MISETVMQVLLVAVMIFCLLSAFLIVGWRNKVKKSLLPSELPHSLVSFSRVVHAKLGISGAFIHLGNAEPLRRYEIIECLLASLPEISRVQTVEICQFLSTDEGFARFVSFHENRMRLLNAKPSLAQYSQAHLDHPKSVEHIPNEHVS